MFRQMRRSNQQVEPCEVVRVLTEARRGTLSVAGDDGYPYGVPVNFVFDPSVGEHGAILFHTVPFGHKFESMEAHPKVSFCCIDEGYRNEGEWWWYVTSVVCFGHARVIDDPARKHDALAMLARKYFPPTEDIEHEIAKGGDRVNMIEVVIDHVTGKLVQEK